MNNRIIGIDVARALAVIGMIIVNFKIALGSGGSESIKFFTGLFEGKAAAIFVVLAGIGIALMSNSAVKNNNNQKIKKIKYKLSKKAIFLFIIGLSYIPIWIADILHFYGIYMLITLFLLKSSKKLIISIALILTLIFPLLMLVLNYETGWDFSTFTYLDFWSINGFIRNLFFNGFHPVIPWTAFMLIGLWFGKQDLNNNKFIKKTIWLSAVLFILVQTISKVLIYFLSEGNQALAIELKQILGSSPMPPLPIYMISSSSFAIFIISLCILIAKKFKKNIIITALNKTGQLALTFYVAHVIIGMGIIEIINPKKMGLYSIEFSFLYALIFSFICILFAILWTNYKKTGPLEWIMRKLTD